MIAHTTPKESTRGSSNGNRPAASAEAPASPDGTRPAALWEAPAGPVHLGDAPPVAIATRFKRRELKFVVDAEQRARLTADLLARMTPDPHGDAEGCYPVVDLYFDNRYQDLYWEHARGIESRLKLRLRVYGGASLTIPPHSFLELKRKHKGRVYKQRVALPIDEAMAVVAGAEPRTAVDAAGRRVLEQVGWLTELRLLRPSCVLRYDRQALRGGGDEGDLRVTFDTDIRFRIDQLVPEPDDQGCDRVIMRADRSVMEVKVSHQVPGWLARLIHHHGCQRQGHSKYCRSFESVFLANGTGADARRQWVANLT